MKQHEPQHMQANRAARSSLAEALMAMRTPAEMRALLKDLTTPAELEALVDRWRVVRYLDQGKPYREIHDLTGVSVTTIGRVARYLENGNGGYRLALERIKQGES
ncbi:MULTISPECIES: YerC/YecD family TrpR-related protein [unclassified Wenzhouxiangella]|uniref:YerC/YecD family TrpR-related protein n=1 Tax=unclassified Wenzhouxiangella TaxID=2613841 RepID=UPI000E32AF84|nr:MULTISPECIES: YerC/YecD family TrpR-related protein [unclassified Wenzhouxiangella]RFF27409.1 DNA-binding transcriptional regulator [Wenzhouxiangella sp. 15181]RFP68837.1 DNA-binding transcriptional regulator [Wenzhouxiangella sp. 15190]